MPLVKTILKNSSQEVIVKWVGSGTDTLTLASLVATGQTVSGTIPPSVTITGIKGSVSSTTNAIVARNLIEVLVAYGNFTYGRNDPIYAGLGEQAKEDIVVTLAASGSLILKLYKTQGYVTT